MIFGLFMRIEKIDDRQDDISVFSQTLNAFIFEFNYIVPAIWLLRVARYPSLNLHVHAVHVTAVRSTSFRQKNRNRR